MNGIKKFLFEYRGAIIGGIIAIVIVATKFYELILCIVLVLLGIIAGNYIQKNKFDVKEKIKEFIDRW